MSEKKIYKIIKKMNYDKKSCKPISETIEQNKEVTHLKLWSTAY